ncbi:MAG TPA: putative quinol monooxygenase [Gaiellaceae bacterium]|nr:putative quinol monooxygenase [Gaiellaceae bacterium]
MPFVLVAKWMARPDEEDRVRDCLERLAVASRQEPGCRFYQPCQDPADPRAFLIFEIYDDEAACDAHRETAHFQEIAAGEAFPLLESRERRFYETL